jgi:hypothetical protein
MMTEQFADDPVDYALRIIHNCDFQYPDLHLFFLFLLLRRFSDIGFWYGPSPAFPGNDSGSRRNYFALTSISLKILEEQRLIRDCHDRRSKERRVEHSS